MSLSPGDTLSHVLQEALEDPIYATDFDRIDPFQDPFGRSDPGPEVTPPVVSKEHSTSTINLPKSKTGSSTRPSTTPRETTPSSSHHVQCDLYLPVEKDLCWRCGYPGHRRTDCTKKAVLFCSRCGRVGNRSDRCSCTRPKHRQSLTNSDSRTQNLKTKVSTGVQCDLHSFRYRPCHLCGCPYGRRYHQ